VLRYQQGFHAPLLECREHLVEPAGGRAAGPERLLEPRDQRPFAVAGLGPPALGMPAMNLILAGGELGQPTYSATCVSGGKFRSVEYGCARRQAHHDSGQRHLRERAITSADRNRRSQALHP